MHIPDGFLSLPVSLGTLGASGAYGFLCHKKIRARMNADSSMVPLIGCVTAFIFAAQMLNFPILGGTSGHFMGGAFAVALFGPYIAFFILTIVLLIQALFFGDGGLLALGANVLNMAIISPVVAFLVLTYCRKLFKSETVLLFFASLVSVVCAAVSCSILIALSGTIAFYKIIVVMTSVHILIGIGEGIITSSALAFLKKASIIKKEPSHVQV